LDQFAAELGEDGNKVSGVVIAGAGPIQSARLDRVRTA